jgi:methionyl aminopeptidase
MTAEPPTKRKCLGDDCDNDIGTLQCPKCLSLGIKDSFFCSQDCFKKNWVGAKTPAPPRVGHDLIRLSL